MGDIMRPIPFEELLTRIFDEYQQQRSIFGIPEQQFYSPVKGKTVSVFGETCATPVGPAAGPHTQLAQNIVTSWLTGGRFIELKTVQILDRLELEKPCIDAEDECFNTEWSTEFTLLKAWDEYLKAWFALHLLEAMFQPSDSGKSFLNSVSQFFICYGHDCAGQQHEKRRFSRRVNHVVASRRLLRWRISGCRIFIYLALFTSGYYAYRQRYCGTDDRLKPD